MPSTVSLPASMSGDSCSAQFGGGDVWASLPCVSAACERDAASQVNKPSTQIQYAVQEVPSISPHRRPHHRPRSNIHPRSQPLNPTPPAAKRPSNERLTPPPWARALSSRCGHCPRAQPCSRNRGVGCAGRMFGEEGGKKFRAACRAWQPGVKRALHTCASVGKGRGRVSATFGAVVEKRVIERAPAWRCAHALALGIT